MNRFNAEHPELDGEELEAALIEALNEKTASVANQYAASSYEEVRGLVTIIIAKLRWDGDPAYTQVTTAEKATAEEITKLVWQKAEAISAKRLDQQLRAMLRLLHEDGHVTPQAVRQISKVLEANYLDG